MGNAISKEVHLEPIERAAQNTLILGTVPANSIRGLESIHGAARDLVDL